MAERMDEHELLRWALRGEEHAIAFVLALARISQVWDDLIDGDQTVAPEEITGAFRRALIEIPLNPFYRAYSEHLVPVMDAVILDWMTANQIEAGAADEQAQAVAYVLRDQLASLIVVCARLLAGDAWAMAVAKPVRLWVHDEPLDEYRKGVHAWDH